MAGSKSKRSKGKTSKPVSDLAAPPTVAHVRCFSSLERECAVCLPGNRYIPGVAVNVMRGDDNIARKPTGNGGCVRFDLDPGWYAFSAPQDVTIEGCNYTLASSSPISAFVGAGQSCSDIFFCYKKKGNGIKVTSEIHYQDPTDPFVPASNSFAGMQYLLVGESDPTFVPQQQTSSDGGAVSFPNLPAGIYLLFCQAPAAYDSQPVHPVYPKCGRLALAVFCGQTSAIPVLVKFRTWTSTPAVLDGFVRNEAGQPVAGQLVQILNDESCLVAAGLTDAAGHYSIQIYCAEDLTIVFGTARISVSKNQIEADMRTVGTQTLPAP